MNKKLKQDKAITLVALVVTIIVLIILAGISFNLVLGENGIVNKAKEAASAYGNAAANEKMELLIADLEMSKYFEKGKSLKEVIDGLNDSSITTKEVDDNTVEVTVDDKYVFIVKGDENGKIEVQPQGEASGITLSSTKGTIYYPETSTITFDVLNNQSGGKLSVESKNTNIATASISGTKVTVQAKGSYGTTKIVVKSQANAGYAEGIATYEVTVENRAITINATAYSGTYDGNAHDAITSIEVTPSDAKIEYSVDGGDYSTTMPQVTNATSYTISIRASKDGYTTKEITKTVTIGTVSSATASGLTKTYTGSSQTGVSGSNVDWSGTTSATKAGTYTAYATPKTNYTWSDGTTTQKTITWEIKKAKGELTLTETSFGIGYNGGRNIETTKNASGGTISATSSDPSIATVYVSGTDVIIEGSGDATKAGTVTVTVTSAATDNYEAATVTITVNVTGKITATATGYTGTYDKNAHGITVTSNVSGATIKYAKSQNGTYSTTKPTYTDAGTYTTYYKIEKEGYTSATGSAMVTINKGEIKISVQFGPNFTLGVNQAPYSVSIGFTNSSEADFNVEYSSGYGYVNYSIENGRFILTPTGNAPSGSTITYAIYAESKNYYGDYEGKITFN